MRGTEHTAPISCHHHTPPDPPAAGRRPRLVRGFGGVLQLQDMADVYQNCILAFALCFEPPSKALFLAVELPNSSAWPKRPCELL